jgi:hypothetical protein
MSDSGFCRTALLRLKSRVTSAATEYGQLAHMLVLPEGRSTHYLGVPREFRGPPTEFGRSKIAGQIPPAHCWPKDLKPLFAVVVVPMRPVYNPIKYEASRIHLFFGDEPSFRALEPLAVDLLKLRADVVGYYGMKFERTLGMTVLGGSAAIDIWGREIHQRAWVQYASPIHTKPKAIFDGEPIDVDPTDKAFTEYPSFSRLDCSVFAATAAIIDTYLEWLAKGAPSSSGAFPSGIHSVHVDQGGLPSAATAKGILGMGPSVDLGRAARNLDKDEIRDRLRSIGKPDPRPDGPVPPDAFWYKGSIFHGLQPKPYRLVEHLWTCTNMTADVRDLAEPVWGDHEAETGDNALGSVRRQANRFFQRHAIPYQVRIKNKTVLLERRPA